MPVLAGLQPTGQANVVLIIRINSPGNDGPITQINGVTITVLRPEWSALRQACRNPASATVGAPAALGWAKSCAGALRAAGAREASVGTPISAHRVRARPPRPRPTARAPVLQYFEPQYFQPVREAAGASASTPREKLVHAPARGGARRRHRRTPAQPPPSAPVQDWLPTVPGPASTVTPASGGQGGAVLGLLAVTCLTLLPGVISRRSWPSSVLRETLRGARLERPG